MEDIIAPPGKIKRDLHIIIKTIIKTNMRKVFIITILWVLLISSISCQNKIDKIDIYYYPYEAATIELPSKDAFNKRPGLDSIKNEAVIGKIMDKIGQINADTNHVYNNDPYIKLSLRFYSHNKLIFRIYYTSSRQFYSDNYSYENDYGLLRLIFDSITIDDRFRNALQSGGRELEEILKNW